MYSAWFTFFDLCLMFHNKIVSTEAVAAAAVVVVADGGVVNAGLALLSPVSRICCCGRPALCRDPARSRNVSLCHRPARDHRGGAERQGANFGVMLDHCLRQWASITLELGYDVMFLECARAWVMIGRVGSKNPDRWKAWRRDTRYFEPVLF